MTFRSTAALAAAALSAAALLAVPATAGNAAGTPLSGTPQLKSLGLTGQVVDMAVADGRIWVSTGNEVDVFSTAGQKLTTITGLLGADGLLASADGTQVYAALSQSSAIVTLDAASMTQTASWTTSTCPTGLALAAGRLFYSFGCTTGTAGYGISSLSLSDGSSGPVTTQGSAPQLRGAGSTLVTADESGSPTLMNSYTAATDGTLTALSSIRTGEGYDFALSPDGGQLVVTGYDAGYNLERFNTADMSPAGTFEMGPYPKAVAYSPDGSSFAGALSSSSDDMLRVFNASSGSLTSHSAAKAAADQNYPSILSDTLHFSADGTRLYGIAQDSGATARLVVATSLPVTAGSVSATVTSPKAYGRSASIRISAPGRPGTRVSVTVPALSGTKTVSGTTNSSGIAVVKATSPLSGTVSVTLAGDLTRSARTVTRSVKVPARLTAGSAGYYSTKGGVRHYHSLSSVDISVQALPQRALTVQVVIQAKVGKKWVTGHSGPDPLSSTGAAAFYLKSGNKHVVYRFKFAFTGDSLNTKAPTVTSKSFIID